MRTVQATRYVTPFREGGSLPALVEGDDLGLYVLKFRGAGQGPLALAAEIIAGEIGRALGLRVPELVLMEVDAALSRNEPDYEIRELLKASAGLNMAMDFLPGSVMFDRAAKDRPSDEVASAAVWFDAFVTNIDRTRRAIRTCCCGTRRCTSSITARRSTSTTIGRTRRRRRGRAFRRSKRMCCCRGRRGWSRPTGNCTRGSTGRCWKK
jgi:hypothetical protein